MADWWHDVGALGGYYRNVKWNVGVKEMLKNLDMYYYSTVTLWYSFADCAVVVVGFCS